jgi:multisubunit Na+/H+ antiporter MnhE subunit
MRVISGTTLLTIIYCLSLGSTSPWDIGIGAVLALGILYTFRNFLFHGPSPAMGDVPSRAIHFPMLVLATVFDIVRGTLDVAKVVLRPAMASQGGMVEIPEAGRTASGVVVSGLINTISPGSVLVDIDPQTLNWTIHCVDASKPEKVVAWQQSFYDRFQRSVWP